MTPPKTAMPSRIRLRSVHTFPVLLLALLSEAAGQLVPQPPFVQRGDIQTITGSTSTIQTSIKTISLRPLAGSPSDEIPVTPRTSTDKDFSFIVVSSDPSRGYHGIVPFGRYDLVLRDASGAELPNKLQAPVEVKPGDILLNSADAFDPYPATPLDNNGQPKSGEYTIDLEGKGFSEIPTENTILLDERPLVNCSDPNKKDCAPDLAIEPGSGGTHLRLSGIPIGYHGTHKVRVRVGGKEAPDEHPRDNETTVTLSWVAEWVPAAIAIGSYITLASILYFLMSAGLRKLAAAQELEGVLSMMFLEPETNSFSLSKLQFYLWTGAAVLGYVYLTAARSLAQGYFEWGDIPAGLPAIILASAGTTVAVSGVSAAKGSKGAGEIGPNLSDFITTGGVVAPERVQFLVWTLVGVTSFLTLVFLSSPIHIHGLPAVPSGFLQLMGISAAGYVGGKLVRKAGPKISSIDGTIDPASGNLTLNITGGVLSQSGSFEIDDRQISPSSIMNDLDPHRPKPGAKDPTANDPDLFQSMELTIHDPDETWLTPAVDHNLTIYNPDGQKAVWTYCIATGKTLQAVAVTPATAGAAAHVLVTAPGFARTDTFTYTAMGGGSSTVAAVTQAEKPYLFDVSTGAPAGTTLTIKIAKPPAGNTPGSSAVSDSVTV